MSSYAASVDAPTGFDDHFFGNIFTTICGAAIGIAASYDSSLIIRYRGDHKSSDNAQQRRGCSIFRRHPLLDRPSEPMRLVAAVFQQYGALPCDIWLISRSRMWHVFAGGNNIWTPDRYRYTGGQYNCRQPTRVMLRDRTSHRGYFTVEPLTPGVRTSHP